jgi:hypothetical protein
MARSEDKIKEGARSFLEPSEQILAAFVARPRGWTQARASQGGGAVTGLIGGALGSKKQRESVDAAERAQFTLSSPMALAVTPERLLSLKVSAPVGLGIGMKVQELLDATPISEVDSIEVKRLAAGKTIKVTIRGVPFVLEAGAGANVKGVVEGVERAKTR